MLCPRLPQNSYSQHLLRTDPSTRFLFSASPTPRYPSRCVVQFNSASAMKTSITSPSQSVISTSYKLTELLYRSSAVPCLLTVIVAMDITSTVHSYLSLQLGMPRLLHCGISFSSTEDIYSPSLLPRVPTWYYRHSRPLLNTQSTNEWLGLLQLFLVKRALASTR